MPSQNEKVAILSGGISNWVSCKTIKNNLYSAYRNSLPAQSLKLFHMGTSDLWPADISECFHEINEYNPDVMVFIDHLPNPNNLISMLSTCDKLKDKKFIFHVYGDFIHYFQLWHKCLTLLEGMDVKIICASKAQSDLVNNLILNEENVVDVIPFPVDRDQFSFSEEKRKDFRRKMSISEDTTVLVYTGRLSYQKNVVKLIDAVDRFKTKFNANIRLYIAGPFDDLGVPYLGKKMTRLTYLRQCIEQVNNLDYCEYLGVLNTEELQELYNGSDIFCSLSVHNDEDYGMSPAEALMTGAYGVLSSWGGYKSFKLEGNSQVQLVPVEIREKDIDVDLIKFIKSLFAIEINEETLKKRNELSEAFSENFSVKAVESLIKKLLNSPYGKFKGFDPKVSGYLDMVQMDSLFQCFAYSDQYREVYEGKYD